MSPLAVQILRRVAVYSVALTVLLAVVPPLFVEVGLLGPGVRGEIEAAERAVAAARAYGAKDDEPALGAALTELQRARDLAGRGHEREGRHAALRAQESAVKAQRTALAGREESRRRAHKVVEEVDRAVNDLEDLYAAMTPGLEKPALSRLFSLMKNARQTGGGLVLAYEQGSYEKVLADERGVKDVLDSVGNELKKAKR